MKDIIDKCLAETNHIISNLKKAPNRRYKRYTIEQKLKIIQFHYNAALTAIEEISDEFEFKFKLTAVRKLYADAKYLLEQRLATATNNITFFTAAFSAIAVIKFLKPIRTKMASPLEMIKLVSSLVDHYDGDSKKLDSTFDSIKTIGTLVTAGNQVATIKAVVSRFSDKAREVLPIITDETTIDQIVTALEACKIKRNPDVALATLNATKQGGDAKTFIANIEKNTRALEQAYIEDGDTKEVATKHANRAGIKALLVGLKCNETTLLIKAGKHTKLTDATEAAWENLLNKASSTSADATILNIRTNNYRGRGNRV